MGIEMEWCNYILELTHIGLDNQVKVYGKGKIAIRDIASIQCLNFQGKNSCVKKIEKKYTWSRECIRSS